MPENEASPVTWWANENTGAIVCSEHAGAELTANIRSYPKRVSHVTPFGTYEKMGEFEQRLLVTACEQPSIGAMCDTPHAGDEVAS